MLVNSQVIKLTEKLSAHNAYNNQQDGKQCLKVLVSTTGLHTHVVSYSGTANTRRSQLGHASVCPPVCVRVFVCLPACLYRCV